MAKDRKKLQHIHSSIADKQPTPLTLEVGEIAVNNAKDQEFLSIKNTDDKVVRFSSDSQIIDWMERKEVMPYVGYVRGETGPSATSADTPTADSMGSYGITNNDLLNNTSEIIIKLNQVAASATTKHDKVNGKKDRYNKLVNPTTDGGVNDGAGFFIDMSRYAMRGGNPSFSSLTVTDKTDLSGNTTITDGDGTGTRTGKTFTVKVTNENETVTTLNESATTRTTKIGTENLNVSGTTTEVKVGNVTESNSGTTTIDRKGAVSVNNQSNVTEVTSGNSTVTISGTSKVNVSGSTTADTGGNVTVMTSGTTTETKKGNVSETNQANYTLVTSGTTTETKIGNVTENHSGTTIENKKGVVTENNLSAKTENTTGVLTENNSSNHILNTTGTTNITRTGAVTEDNKNNVTRTTSGTTTETYKGQVTENNQSGYTINTTGNVIVNTTGTTTETKTGNVTENHSGTTTENYAGKWTVNVTSGTEITSCSSTTINTDKMEIIECTSAGTITISAQTQTINGGNLTITESGNTSFNTSGNTTINVGGNLTENVTGTTTITRTGAVTENNKGGLTITTTGKTCMQSTTDVNIGGDNSTNIGVTCAGGVYSNNVGIYAQTGITETANTVTISGTTSISAKTPTTYVSGTTLNIKETNTDIESCGRISGKTNAFTVQECATGSGKTVINQTDIDISGKTFDVVETTSATIKAPATTISGTSLTIDEGTSISAKTPTTTFSGTNFTLNETNTTINSCGKVEITTDKFSINQCSDSGGSVDFKFCNGFKVESNDIKLHQCGTAGTISISAQTQNINGGNLTINESGNTAINTTGTTNIISTGSTNVEVKGANNKVTIQSTGNGGDVEVFAKDTLCASGGTTAAFVGATKTNIGKNCADGGQTTTLNINGTTINETGTTVNISGSSTTNISGATVNISGGSITEISTGKTCITAGSDLNLGGDTNTRLGYNCDGTGIANNTYVYASSAVTINAPTTNITGNTYLSGNTYFRKTCTGLTNNEIDAAFCEVLSRGAVSMDVTSNPAPGILKRYTIKQNGANISGTANGVIDVPKDFLLKSAAVVYGNASADRTSFTACTGTQTNCHWYIELVFNVKDGTSEESKLYLEEDDFIKDITDNNPSGVVADSSYNNVAVKVEYDGKKNVVSATTTPTVHVKENLCADGTVSGATVSGTSTSAGTLTVTGNTTLKATTATTLSATSVTSPDISGTSITAATKVTTKDLDATGNVVVTGTVATTGGLTKKLTWAAGTFTADTTGYNGSADKVITVPTDASHITRKTLKITHNGHSDTYDPGSADKDWTLPHSALSIDYGVVVTGKTDDSYDTSAAKTVSIPTAVSHISRGKLKITHNGLANEEFDPASDKSMTLPHSALTIDYNVDVRQKADTSYDTSAAATVSIPGSLDHLSNYDGTNINIGHPTNINGAVCVTGTVTASGAIYSSDKNLKENIVSLKGNKSIFDKVADVDVVSFNFKDDEYKNTKYGVIAQDVQKVGLEELVYETDSKLGVDYTSLLMLKIAYLEDTIKKLNDKIEKLEK